MQISTIDTSILQQWWQIFVNDDDFTEVRILGKYQYSGYFKSLDNLINALTPYTQYDDEQIYFTLNSIDKACYGRQQSEKIVKSPKSTTSDNDIIRRKWVLIDLDPKRAVGVNASAEELEKAHQKAREVYVHLKKFGFHDPVICISGNGYHLQYKCNLPNTEDATNVIKDFLKVLSLNFSDEAIEVDEKVFNAGRICKLYGTVAKKGANIDARPWRMSKIVYVPDGIKENDIELFKSVAAYVPKAEPTQNIGRGGFPVNTKFDLDSFLNEHGIKYKKEAVSGGSKYILDHCLFNEAHRGKDAVIFQLDNGAISYNCFHNSCRHHTWRDVRLMFDPHAYDVRNDRPYYDYRQPQPRQVEIKKEDVENIGKKWLTLGDITDENIDDLKRIPTGFEELDYSLGGGLFMGETSILSGINGSGKSSLLNTIILNAVDSGSKVALWTGELRAPRFKRWITQVAAGDYNKESLRSPGKYYVPQPILAHIIAWIGDKFFLYNNDYSANQAQIFTDMEEPVKSGCELIILDNLFAMDLDGLTGDENAKQKQLILKLADFAKTKNIHIILVAHPRKVVTFLRKEDILGSSALQNAVDNIFIIHRTGTDFARRAREVFAPAVVDGLSGFGNVIEVCKNREFGTIEKLVGLHYNTKSRGFTDGKNEERRYGWNTEPVQQSVTFENTDNTQPDIDNNFPFSRYDKDAPF